ncbi:hypothetical protein G7066_09355 [Leucobacter coleopterorum]|uniref:AbiEi antitoxin N-terminal domain-containing protein n=1 Tax=Leucobacter coleopterorum TaxID=2714933 RepID=A0ABX6JWS8_9MICO|nr:type IV toxin-antitoxin system AbiEi family antitoxin domain-containing protein [Leucobacter coleopterorum]QIM18759.1 hypothetical protein G7066_09355 [Leucobacter coleopterorum]
MALQNFEQIRGLVRSRAALLREGSSEREIVRRVRNGTLLRLSRGMYARPETLSGLTPEERHLVYVIAVAKTRRVDNPFSSHSAAALLRLPLFGFREARPQILVSHQSGSSSTHNVERRSAVFSENEIVTVSGIRCTNLDRTVLDLSRFDSPELAIACADEAIRMRFPLERGQDPQPIAKLWRQKLLEQLEAVRGTRGVRRAARVIQLADGTADSPLESVARLRFTEFGYDVAAQVRVPSPNGTFYYVDLELLGLGIFCEVDGKKKYTDPSIRNGKTADEVVLEEKRRSNWIEGTTKKRVLRLGYRELVTPLAFANWLRANQVPPPPK